MKTTKLWIMLALAIILVVGCTNKTEISKPIEENSKNNLKEKTTNDGPIDLLQYYSPNQEGRIMVTSNKITWSDKDVTFIAEKRDATEEEKAESMLRISSMTVAKGNKNYKIQVNPNPIDIYSLSLSSSNQYLAVSLYYNFGHKLMLIDLSNGEYSILNDVLEYEGNGTVESISANNWSPNGKKLAFSYGKISESKLAIFDVEEKIFNYISLGKDYLGIYRIIWNKDRSYFDYISDFPQESLKLNRYNINENTIDFISDITDDELINLKKIGSTQILMDN